MAVLKICFLLLACFFSLSLACSSTACVSFSILTNRDELCTCILNEQAKCTNDATTLQILKTTYSLTCGGSEMITDFSLLFGALLMSALS